MKFYKLYCDTYHCDTEFLVKVKDDENNPEYFSCPECEGTVWVKDGDVVDIELK